MRPGVRHLGTVGTRLCGEAAQPRGAGLQASVIVVAEARLFHEIEHPLNVIFDPMQGELPIVGREGSSGIVVSRLPDGTRIAVRLAAARVNRLDVGMAGGETVSGDLGKIRIRPFEVLVDRVGPSAMHDVQPLDPELHREAPQPIHVLGRDDRSEIHHAIVDALGSETRAAARHVPVVIAHHAADPPGPQLVTALIDLGVVADDVAEADHLGHVHPVELGENCRQGLVVAVDVRNESDRHE